MEKLIAIVQIGSLTQRYDLPQWARDNIEVLGGPGFVVRGQQFHWYDYIVKTEWEGVKGMSRTDINTMAHNGNLINSIQRSCT
ncbi:hypothetical protein ACSA002_1900 [Salmonella phage vB_SalM_SA002]|nr:hypothetical protein ACSA002_1900 [Salmonella phage vB_SalM_SA002]